MSEEKKELMVSANDLALVDSALLNAHQLGFLLKKTPKKYVRERPAKGGGKWKYVSGGYVKKVLTMMFGANWDFEIVDDKILLEAKQVLVKGKLTCRVQVDGHWHEIVRMQYGKKDVMMTKHADADGIRRTPLDLGNDMKAACTDALKKCASEIGIAADIYNAEEFREVKVAEPMTEEKQRLLLHIQKASIQQLIEVPEHWLKDADVSKAITEREVVLETPTRHEEN